NVIPFQVPPLRERREDVPALIEHFNRRFSAENQKPPKEFTDAAVASLQNYTWPGNVRELKNLIERVVIMSSKAKIDAADLPEVDSVNGVPASSFRFPSFKDATDAYQREFIRHKLVEHNGNVARTAASLGVDRSHLYRRMRSLGIK